MNILLPINSPQDKPSQAGFHSPVGSGMQMSNPTTPRTPCSPVQQAAQSLARQLFTENTDLPTTASPNPRMVGTPGRVARVTNPSNQLANDIHVFPKGLTTYRSDNSYNPRGAYPYSAQFFTFDKQVAKDNYGKLVLKFTLQKEIKVLRLDKNADGFQNWLEGTKQFSSSEKEILYTNFGYPRMNPDSAGLADQPRPRVSSGNQDRTMLKMIECYAKETGQKIDGYYNSTMPNGALGNMKTEDGRSPLFHAELAVFDGNVFSQPEMANNLSQEDINLLNQEAKRIRMEKQDQEARRSKKKQRPDW